GLAVLVVALIAYFGRELFVLCMDEDTARAAGLPVRFLSLLVSITAAVTVVISMRVVGVLMVSALMVVPVVAAQQLTRSFRVTAALAVAIGVLSAVGGLSTAFYADVAPGAAIVLLTLAVFAVAVVAGRLVRSRGGRAAEEHTAPAGGTGAAVGTMPQDEPGSVST